MNLFGFRDSAMVAALGVFVFADMSAGPVTRHTAEIMAVIRGVMAGILVAMAVAVIALACYAVSARPVIRQQCRSRDDDLLPPPVQADPGWVRVASVHGRAPEVPLPGTRRSGVVDSGRQEDDQEAIR